MQLSSPHPNLPQADVSGNLDHSDHHSLTSCPRSCTNIPGSRSSVFLGKYVTQVTMHFLSLKADSFQFPTSLSALGMRLYKKGRLFSTSLQLLLFKQPHFVTKATIFLFPRENVPSHISQQHPTGIHTNICIDAQNVPIDSHRRRTQGWWIYTWTHGPRNRYLPGLCTHRTPPLLTSLPLLKAPGSAVWAQFPLDWNPPGPSLGWLG